MKTNHFVVGLLCAIVLLSCDKRNQKDINDYKTLANITNAPKDVLLSHQAAVEANTSNCLQTTQLLEQKILQLGGYIITDKITKNEVKVIENELNADSIQKLVYYTTNATLTFKVPDTNLIKLIDYTQANCTELTKRVLEAEEIDTSIIINNNENQSNKEVIYNLTMANKAIKYATISINLTEPTRLQQLTLINQNAHWAKSPTLFQQIKFALHKGLWQLGTVLVFLLQFWWAVPLFFLLKLGYKALFKYYAKYIK